eukprot:6209675-Pleurochrysis_carterae.AAC.1
MTAERACHQHTRFEARRILRRTRCMRGPSHEKATVLKQNYPLRPSAAPLPSLELLDAIKVLTIQRKVEQIVPHAHTKLHADDEVVLCGRQHSIAGIISVKKGKGCPLHCVMASKVLHQLLAGPTICLLLFSVPSRPCPLRHPSPYSSPCLNSSFTTRFVPSSVSIAQTLQMFCHPCPS